MNTLLIDIRPATRRDAAAVADVHYHAWMGAYSGIIPHAALQRMVARRDAKWWENAIRRSSTVLVVEFDSEVVGYATIGKNRARGLPQQGEIYELYILPEFQGIGLGTKLFAAARKRLAARGLRGLVVWVLEDNPNAVRFYESTGGVDSAESVEVFDHKALKKIAYTWH
jgi:ribosomal protein S18 acetylase RimI-like enzyme